MDQKAQQTITKYLGDLHALLDHGRQPLSQQVGEIRKAGHPEALHFVEEVDRGLRRQIDDVDARLKALGGSPTGPVKEAVSAVAGVAAGVYDHLRTEAASKAVRDDYTFLGLTGVSYLMLHTTAMSLGDAETAALAARGYRDCAQFQMEVDRIMPGLVLAELRQDGFAVTDVTADCRQLVHDAWSSGRGTFDQPSRAAAYAPLRSFPPFLSHVPLRVPLPRRGRGGIAGLNGTLDPIQ